MIRHRGQDWVQAGEAAELLGDDVTAAMVRDWGRRGLCRRYTWRSHTWYLWTQVQAVELQTRLSKAGAKRGVMPGRKRRGVQPGRGTTTDSR